VKLNSYQERNEWLEVVKDSTIATVVRIENGLRGVDYGVLAFVINGIKYETVLGDSVILGEKFVVVYNVDDHEIHKINRSSPVF